MTNNNSTYKRLGDYIEQRREKNKGFDVPIRGVSREGFIPPKQQDADVSLYNVFYKNDFVFNPARMELNSIALNEELEQGICSSLYEIFYIKDTNVLDPLYLNLLIKTDHFTRFCEFVGWGSVREYCRFADISEYYIEVPSIEEQHKVVRHYNAIRERIANNKQTIAKLEEAAQALYRKMFVDDVDVENLPDGWRMGTISDFGEIITGKTPSTLDESNFGNDVPFVTIPDMHNVVFVKKTERALSIKGANSQKNKTIPENSICVSCIGTPGLVIINKQPIQTNQQINSVVLKNPNTLYYCYFALNSLKQIIAEYGMGAAVLNNLNKEEFSKLQILIPDNDSLNEYTEKVSSMFDLLYQTQQENKKLTEMLSVVMA